MNPQISIRNLVMYLFTQLHQLVLNFEIWILNFFNSTQLIVAHACVMFLGLPVQKVNQLVNCGSQKWDLPSKRTVPMQLNHSKTLPGADHSFVIIPDQAKINFTKPVTGNYWTDHQTSSVVYRSSPLMNICTHKWAFERLAIRICWLQLSSAMWRLSSCLYFWLPNYLGYKQFWGTEPCCNLKKTSIVVPV